MRFFQNCFRVYSHPAIRRTPRAGAFNDDIKIYGGRDHATTRCDRDWGKHRHRGGHG